MDPAIGNATTHHQPLATYFADGATRSNFEGMKFQEMAPFLRGRFFAGQTETIARVRRADYTVPAFG